MDSDLGPHGTETVCEMCAVELDRIAEAALLTGQDLALLKQPRRRVNANIPVRMDDGTVEVFPYFRIQYNSARGPTKGGIRFHPGVDENEVDEPGVGDRSVRDRRVRRVHAHRLSRPRR